MSTFRFSPDDPKFTAYALGQLNEADRAAVEAVLREDAAARAFVEQTRAFSAELADALAAEPLPDAHAPVVALPSAAQPTPRPNGHDVSRRALPQYGDGSKLLRFPQLYFVIGGLAAACFAVLLALRTSPETRAPREVKVYREVHLNPPPSATAAAVDNTGTAAAGATPPSIFQSKDEKGGLLAQVTADSADAIAQSVRAKKFELAARDADSAVHRQQAAMRGQVMLAAARQQMERRLAYAAPAPHFNTEAYAHQADNGFVTPQQAQFSTFSVDVDTASYANVRRFLQNGSLPPPDAVRIEELLNYFPYAYAAPAADAADPIAASFEVADAPWAPTHRLVRIGLKARAATTEARPPANLVFLLDVSGSMNEPRKLPLVKESMHLLVEALRPDDRVAIVTYAGQSGLALPSTPVAKIRDIEDALDALTAGGSTNGAMGIQLAYDIAKANFVPGGINRVILCTDGDFNVGVTSQGELTRLIEEKAKSGVALTALGFGMGNIKDSTLELLADKGNGNYGYIDTRAEADKLLAKQINGTLMTVAKDVKIQVDFNPARVASYRLIGYENRQLAAQDFNNDATDAGDMGAGHAVTALYEIVPVGAEDAAAGVAPAVDVSRYASAAAPKADAATARELLTVKIRYKQPDADVSRKLEFPLVDAAKSFAMASADFRFAAAVAQYGMILRQSPQRGHATLADVLAWAAAAASPKDDPGGYRNDFIDLIRRTQTLMR